MRWAKLLKLLVVFCLVISGLLLVGNRNASGKLKVHFIDVGYADAILVQLPDSSVMMIDAGEEETSSKVLAYLQAQRIKRIDTVIITHPHTNHFGGFFAIAHHFPIDKIFINGDTQAEEGYTELLDLFKEKKIPVKTLRAGMSLPATAPDVRIKILNPDNLKGSANGNSIVTWLKFKKTSFLFTADIKAKQQNRIVRHFAKRREVFCVQVPHHGRAVSDDFAKTFQNSIWIASTGPNPWGAPPPGALERLDGIVRRTDQEGTIIIISDGKLLYESTH